MSDRASAPARRAQRLLRCYPAPWRERYGDEFTALLIDEISERPRCWRRAADVICSAAVARLACAGLTGDALEPEQQQRAGLAWLCAALAAFLALGIAIWSQLTVGWQWSAPAAPATRAAMIVMSAAVLGFAVLALLAVLPVAWAVGVRLRRATGSGRWRSPALVLGGGVVFILGSVHFGHGWPGTGGHLWAERGLVPDAVARFCWAATLWVTSYWAHPGALSAFPAPEVAWMAASPLALIAIAAGARGTLRGTRLSPRVLRLAAWLGGGAAVTMAVFLAGAGSWIVSGGPAPRGLFRVGAIDGLALAAMTAALALAFRSLQRTLLAGARRPAGR